MSETATAVDESPATPASRGGFGSHAGPAEPDIAPVPDISGHFVVGAVEAVGGAHAGAAAAPGVAYGGRFAPESLMAALDELTAAWIRPSGPSSTACSEAMPGAPRCSPRPSGSASRPAAARCCSSART